MSDFPVVKILPSNPGDLNHFLSAFGTDLLLNQKIDYVAGGSPGAGQAEYIGYALPGTPTSAPAWLIKKLFYDASNRVVTIQFANGKIAFDQIYDNHTGLSYS